MDDNSIPARGKITGAYINSAFARSEAHWNGYDEAIVLTQDGHVSEGSAENFFLIRHGKLVTPGVHDNILEGVTRAIFTHCGSEIVREDGRVAEAKVEALGRERGVRATIAYDGLEVVLRCRRVVVPRAPRNGSSRVRPLAR